MSHTMQGVSTMIAYLPERETYVNLTNMTTARRTSEDIFQVNWNYATVVDGELAADYSLFYYRDADALEKALKAMAVRVP